MASPSRHHGPILLDFEFKNELLRIAHKLDRIDAEFIGRLIIESGAFDTAALKRILREA